MRSIKTGILACLLFLGPLGYVSTGPSIVEAQGTSIANGYIDVMQFGAIPDNPTADNTLAFQRAIDAAALRGGGIVYVPFFRFYFRGNIVIKEGVVLAGKGVGEYDLMQSPTLKRQGPTLLSQALAGIAFIRVIGANSGIQDLIITYPTQNPPSASSPKVFPPTIQAEMPTKIRRMALTNSYIGISVLVGRVFIENCLIGAYKNDIIVDNALDEVRITHVIIEPLWDWKLVEPQPIDFWVRAIGVGITLRKADGTKLTDVLIHGRHVGIVLEASLTVPDGGPNGSATDINLDTVVHGIIATATEERIGFTFTNLELGPISNIVIPGLEYGHAIWLKRLGQVTTTPPRINVVGGSIRQLWATKPTGEDWAFRVDVGDLYLKNIIGYDLGPRL